MSLLLPPFLERLSAPEIKTVLLCGCGGGFDFVHALILYPELARLGKKVIIGSYSFGDPHVIGGEAPVVFEDRGATVKRVTAASIPAPHYGPEVHVCSYLDRQYPDTAPHFVYAYYARAFTVPTLTSLYQQFVDKHDVDAVVVVDGGSDSLMVGDEEGLGDPVEDAVTIGAVNNLNRVKQKLLIAIGLGADRFNHVSDAASLRAISELATSGGYLGSVGLVLSSPGFEFYRSCIEHIYERQAFRSVIAGMIIASVGGTFGGDHVPPSIARRLQPGTFFVWPLMGVLWGFDIAHVARRSNMVGWIKDCATPLDCHAAIMTARADQEGLVRDVENLPRHEDMRA